MFDLELCDCHCHNMMGPATSHNYPCCKTCNYCKKNVRHKYYDDHLKDCPAKKKSEEEDTQLIDLTNIDFGNLDVP